MAFKSLKLRLSDNIKIAVGLARGQGHAELADKLQLLYEEAILYRARYSKAHAVLDALSDSARKDRT